MNCTPESGGKKKIPFEKNSKGIFFVKLTLKKIRMSKIRFSKEEQVILRTLIAVTKVSDKTLIFTQAFKRKAVLLSRQGKTANLWLVELVKRTTDSGPVYSEQSIWGDTYCEKGKKCLYNMTLNDTEVICNTCDGIGCTVYVLYK